MRSSSAFAIALAIAIMYTIDPLSGGRYDWMTQDNFDVINDQLVAMEKTNCRANPSARLPYSTLAQLPRFNQLLQVVIHQNRTKLLHLHNSALTRAYYLAFIYQVMNKSEADFAFQPGMEYYYYTQAADLVANPYSINGSALYMDNNCMYANWLQDLVFNTTLPLFGPRAWRLDDYNQPYNWMREPTNSTIFIEDYGSGANLNYTSPNYGNNPWYTDAVAGINYLPDLSGSMTTIQKYSYYAGIKWAAEPGRFLTNQFEDFSFFGPPLPGQKDTYLPVQFTSPYFDCGRTNHWIVSAVSPVVDFMPRYSEWFENRRPRFTGVVSMDTDFLQIDINQCPISAGNEPPNYFANTARCKQATTRCMPLMGWGFRRGGYQCMCNPGYRYPFWQNGPFQGLDIEQATEAEYKAGFDCIPVSWRQIWPYSSSIGNYGSEKNTNTNSSSSRRKRAAQASIDSLVNQLLDNNRTQQQQPSGNFVIETVSSVLRYGVGLMNNLIGGSNSVTHEHGSQPSAQHSKKQYEQAASSQNLLNQSVSEAEGFLLRGSKNSDAKVLNKRYIVRKRREAKSGQGSDEDASAEKEHRRYKRGLPYQGAITNIDDAAYQRMKNIFATKDAVTAANCDKFTATELQLPGDVAYGVETNFDNQARTALRLASFLSAFMQIENPEKMFGNFRGDKPLNVYQVFGEAIANVMGDLFLMSSGVFFDQNAFVHPNGTVVPYFAPWAFRPTSAHSDLVGNLPGDQSQSQVSATNRFLAVDYTGYPNLYVNEQWFRSVKQRWGSNTYGLQKLLLLPYVRTNVEGDQLKNFEQFPIYYRSPSINDGFWTNPYFDCNVLKAWVVTFSAPFFGWNELKTAIQFKGVVTTTVNLDRLDINQCSSPFFVPNAFGNTARCDLQSTYCEPIPGLGFKRGQYKCECRQGYEYPLDDGRTWYFDGMTMENQYDRYMANDPQSIYHILKCREAGAAQLTFSTFTLAVALVLSFSWFK